MVQAIIRPEKIYIVMKALLDGGFPAVTKMDVFGRGKQRGLKVGEVTYDELAKEMLLVVVKNEDQPAVVSTIMRSARTGDKGTFGDGKIFVLPVEESYTISTGTKDEEAA
jgi:nitrogen regulatory protein PII 1